MSSGKSHPNPDPNPNPNPSPSPNPNPKHLGEQWEEAALQHVDALGVVLQQRRRGDIGEIWGRYRGDMGEI